MQNMKLFYTKPAEKWEETLPIGNGNLGAMIWGGTSTERLGLNEDSIWSGYYRDKNNPEAAKYLDKVRKLIIEGEYVAAEKLIQDKMLGEYNESYLPLGDLNFNFDNAGEISDYSRVLDIDNAVAQISFTVGGNQYNREYFSSYPSKAIFIRFTCSANQLNFSMAFNSQILHKVSLSDNTIKVNGKCPEHVDPSYIKQSNSVIQGDKGKEFNAELRVLSCDGEISQNDDHLYISGASEVILAFWAVRPANIAPHQKYEDFLEMHIKDYKAIYEKVELYLGDQYDDIPTDQRLNNLRNGKRDNGLYSLFFQYGRYLLISSSRKGSLPANLQGIWSWEFRPPWSSNWTTNINTQMNYWHAQSCNLQECMPPYFDFVEKICEEGKKTARINYNCRGFVLHHNADFWFNTNPVGITYGESKGSDGSVTYSMWPMGGAWLVSELFKHYEYNPDRDFLSSTVYPILREAALFLIDWLFELNGEYVTCPSTSPENRFRTEDGKDSGVALSTAMDLALVREVFGSFQKTCGILEINDGILKDITKILEKLTPFKTGSKGQLLEWHKEFVENEPGHRHISHLYGLFPSELFEGSPELKNACRHSLQQRLENGGGHTGWSCAWIINVYAVLGDGENAFKYLKTLLTRSTYDNLWDAHPPFQIDGNFGGAAGISNMLVQDRNGEVKILPALPSEFESGYVKGLRIKNGKTVDITWNAGKLTGYNIY